MGITYLTSPAAPKGMLGCKGDERLYTTKPVGVVSRGMKNAYLALLATLFSASTLSAQATHTATTPKPIPAPVSQHFANEAIDALKAIMVAVDDQGNREVDKAMTTLAVDADLEKGKSKLTAQHIISDLQDIKAQLPLIQDADREVGMRDTLQDADAGCLLEETRALRSPDYKGLPESCMTQEERASRKPS
jgi:hypothetical protein